MILYWRRYGKAGGCQIKIKIFYILIGGVAQLGEHLPCKQGVKGSNPFISTAEHKFRWLFFENCILNILNKLKSLDIRGAICTDKSHIKPRNKPND